MIKLLVQSGSSPRVARWRSRWPSSTKRAPRSIVGLAFDIESTQQSQIGMMQAG
jgi:hypothetical protein